MLFVSVEEVPSWFDVLDIIRGWWHRHDSIVDMSDGIGISDTDWFFNLHENEGIVYIDFEKDGTYQVQHSVPVWKWNMTRAEATQFRNDYDKFLCEFNPYKE